MYSLPDILTKKESERYIPSLKAFRLHRLDLWNTKPTTTAISPMIKSSYLTGTTKRTANCTSVNSSVNTFSTLRKTRASRFTTTANIRLYLNHTPVGFGFMDVVRAPQNQLDELKHDMLVNIKVNSQPRVYANTGVGVNNDDMTDLDKTVIEVNGQLQGNIAPVESKELASGAWSLYDRLSNEIKETSATNDASNGASAALQEAGGKVSRDSNKLAQEAMTELAQLEIELMRQFYNLPRIFRITGENNQTTYEEFDNTDLRKQPLTYTDTDGQTVNYTDEDGNILERLPIFDIDVKAQKASPFATAAQNEMMMNLFQMGAFNPQAADATLVMLDGMTFEGKEKLIEKIKQNQTLSQAVQKLSNKVQMLEAMNASRTAADVQNAMPSENAQTAQQTPPQPESEATM